MATDPNRVEQGAGYEAKGLIPTPAEVLVETGSSRSSALRETVPALATQTQRIQTYGTMVKSDAATRTSLRAGKIPVLGGEYFIEPYGAEPEFVEQAELVEYNLFHGMTSPWLSVIVDLLKMYENGAAVGEKVFEIREWTPKRSGANRRKYTMLRKIAPRPIQQVIEFLYDDNGGPAGMRYNAIDAKNKPTEKTIGIDKLIIATYDKDGGNLEGNSILRSAYPHWYYKKHLYNIDAIQKERHGIGVPDVELPTGATKEDSDAAWKLVRNLRTNEEAGIVRPANMNVGFAEMKGQPVNVMESIEHHNGMIMLNIMVQFLIMGLTAGGGRATTASQLDMFIKSMKYVAGMICDLFNLFVIPQLIVYNFDTDKFPKMQVRNIGEERSLQMFASALANLAARNLITMDDETEAWVRSRFDMNQRKTPRPVEILGPNGQPISSNGSGSKGDVQPADDNAGNMPKDTNVT